MLNKSLKTGKVLVTLAAVSVDPTGLAAVGAGLDTLIHVFDVFSSENSDLKKLAKEIDRKCAQELAKPYFDKPTDARLLLPQMLEKSILNADDLAEVGLDAAAIYKRIEASIPRNPDFRSEHFTAFKKLYQPILVDLCNDPRLEAAIRVPLTKATLRKLNEIASSSKKWSEEQEAIRSTLEDLASRMGGLETAVSKPAALTLSELRALASKFGGKDLGEKDDLVNYITLKSDELARLKVEIAALKGLNPRVDNVHSAASEALRNLDLEEAEALISSAKEIHQESTLKPALDENTKLLTTEANISLLRGDVEKAYRTLSTAANSYLVISDKMAVYMHSTLEPMLTNYGQRYGHQGYDFALKLMRDALALVNPDSQIIEYQAVQNDIGNIYLHLSDSLTGKEAIQNLELAEKAFSEAKRVIDPDKMPFDLAMTSNNIANTVKLRARFEKTVEKKKAKLLKAKKLYLLSLERFTPDSYPSENAMVNRNLVACYGQLAGLNKKNEAANHKLYLDALFAGMSAFEYYRKTNNHAELFNTCIDLAIVSMRIYQLGIDGSRGMEISAKEYLDLAESISDQQKSPIYWALVQLNRVFANYTVNLQEKSGDPIDILKTSIAEIDGILATLNASPDTNVASEAEAFRLVLTEQLDALSKNKPDPHVTER
ncbi:hypothetical protein [Ruegeria sp. HKCCD8929]|uniref:hypothetical protein n=1 Tax=Ruegeria sp. HKCCD8929 TaxID=2683006 RepID=UPI001487E69D|nr:hypothetical protein [Ruegeria sp. HKCCD8929]